MTLEIEMEKMEAGALTADQCMDLLQSAQESAEGPSAHEWYRAARGWTGRALRSSCSATYLREWHEVIEALSAIFQQEVDWSVRFDVLRELVFEEIGMIENGSVSMKLARQDDSES